MTAKARFTQSDITRALRAARASGYANAKVTIRPDGTIDILVSNNELDASDNPWDVDASEWVDLD